MATLDTNRLAVSRQIVHNHLTGGTIFNAGKQPKRAVKTKEDLVKEYGVIFDQFGKARSGNRFETIHMSGDKVGHRSEDPGSGGPLIALLEELAKHDPVKANEAAIELHNGGSSDGRLTVESGTTYTIPKSPCSTSDFTDFASRRGLWAGWQGR